MIELEETEKNLLECHAHESLEVRVETALGARVRVDDVVDGRQQAVLRTHARLRLGFGQSAVHLQHLLPKRLRQASGGRGAKLVSVLSEIEIKNKNQETNNVPTLRS